MVAHGSGLLLGRMAFDGAGGEIRGVQAAAQNPRGRVLALDALHSRLETTRLNRDLAPGADYAMPVKDHWPTRLKDIRLLDWDLAAEFATSEKGLVQVETRPRRAIPLAGHRTNWPPC